MASQAQIDASRANALLSTGPRSVEGKAASSQNALKFGIHAQSLIIPGEDPEEFAALAGQYQQQFRPIGPIETALVETIVRSQWMMSRYARIEAQAISTQVAALEPETGYPLGAVFSQDAAGPNVLQKIFRRQQAVQRDWYRAIAELRALQERRCFHEVDDEPQPVAMPPELPAAPPAQVRFDKPAPVPVAPPPAAAPLAGNRPPVPFDNPAWRL
ncbi:MAG TPA: hypothetical protein VE959_13465 [Bryobacteraceae bacterium]|nr:hypothetical protein [Bryobacteraceae bacterium]